jgi:hypothetical protein
MWNILKNIYETYNIDGSGSGGRISWDRTQYRRLFAFLLYFEFSLFELYLRRTYFSRTLFLIFIHSPINFYFSSYVFVDFGLGLWIRNTILIALIFQVSTHRIHFLPLKLHLILVIGIAGDGPPSSFATYSFRLLFSTLCQVFRHSS